MVLRFSAFLGDWNIECAGNQLFYYVQQHHPQYSVNDDSMYVVYNPTVNSINRLLVFLPGTGAKTKHYQLFPNLAANLGYHCISIAYPNGYPTVAMLCAGSSDTSCYANIRQEVCYGTDVSSNVTVDTLNSIYTRIVKTLQFLENTYPDQGWGQFLDNGKPVWSKIAVSGHSQGSGHALYLAKNNSCERLIMFSGADDYSNYYSKPANWTFYAGKTPVSKFFSFLHLHDDVWDYSKQFAVVKAVGMTADGDDSTLVDNKQEPYNNSHCLYTAIDPKYPLVYSSRHDAPVVDFYTPVDKSGDPVYNPVWTYMLTANVITGIEEKIKPDIPLKVFPNPSQEKVTVKFPQGFENCSITLYNSFGSLVLSESFADQSTVMLDVSNLVSGIYFIHISFDNNLINRKLTIVR